jgi:hypothetical protein
VLSASQCPRTNAGVENAAVQRLSLCVKLINIPAAILLLQTANAGNHVLHVGNYPTCQDCELLRTKKVLDVFECWFIITDNGAKHMAQDFSQYLNDDRDTINNFLKENLDKGEIMNVKALYLGVHKLIQRKCSFNTFKVYFSTHFESIERTLALDELVNAKVQRLHVHNLSLVEILLEEVVDGVAVVVEVLRKILGHVFRSVVRNDEPTFKNVKNFFRSE